MLPGCGHFKNIPCPFYKLALCVRPHCPYKHQNTDNCQTKQLFPQLVDESESLLDSKESVTYIPTPVEIKPPGILKSSNAASEKTSFVPEYKPTPISRLKDCSNPIRTRSIKSEYTPEFPIGIRKKKNVEEYDPAEVKCIQKKSVTFLDPSSPADSDVPVILISSEDEELDDSESAPKFSDDELEEESVSTHKNHSHESSKPKPVLEQAKEDDVEIIEIDEFSVVDKILVDSKKNDFLLKAQQNPIPKVKELKSKVNVVQSQDKNKTIIPENGIVKQEKTDEKISIKTEKSFTSPTLTELESLLPKLSEKTKNDAGSKIHKKKNKHIKKIKIDSIKKDKIINIKKEEKCDKLEKPKYKTNKHSENKKDKNIKESEELVNKSKCSKKLSDENHKHKSKKTLSEIHETRSSEKTSNTMSHQVETSSNDLKKRNVKLKQGAISTKKSKNFEDALMASESIQTKMPSNKNSSCSKRKSEVTSSVPEHKSLSPEKKKAKVPNASSTIPKHKPITDTIIPNASSNDRDSDNDVLDDVGLDLSDSDPDEECRRIFNECYPEASTTKQSKVVIEPQKLSDPLGIVRKRRYAHPATLDFKKPKRENKMDIKKPPNPAQVMYNRFAQIQSKITKQNENEISLNDCIAKGSEKKKLNFVPDQSLLAAVKSKVNQNNSKFSPFLPAGVSKTLKVTERVAHIPEAALKPRPIIPADFGSKVPSSVRQKFLNAFIDECLKFDPNEDEAYSHALEEEKKAYERSSSKSLYMNVAANTLKRLRNQAQKEPRQNSSLKTVSHQVVLNGPLAQRRSFSIGQKKQTFDIKDLGRAGLYEHLLQYVMSLEQLKENGFPLPHPVEKDRAVIEGVYANRTSYCNDAFKRVCCRCQKTYYVNVDGEYVRDEECDFHWGRLWKKRIAGALESRYSCCQGDAESDGCCVSAGHVFEGSENHTLKGFVKTLRKTQPMDHCYGIYSLDCEMCYTTAGMELTRVTVIDTDLKTVYESFVKPQHKVLDYNTRFSGITEEDLTNVRTTIHDVQAVLLCIFNDRTILIGHSLESDFKALKFFHKTVVDTSVVFPHKNGLPFKRALRTLMAEKLNKIIQNDVGGHDSHEDASACMELMLWKVKEDLKGNR